MTAPRLVPTCEYHVDMNGDDPCVSIESTLLLEAIVAAGDALRLGDDDCLRCPWCRWPMRESVEVGCVPGNCSMRPLPHAPEARRLAAYDTARAALAKIEPAPAPGESGDRGA